MLKVNPTSHNTEGADMNKDKEQKDCNYPSVDKRKARKTTIENKAATFAKAVNKVSKPLKVK